MGIIIITNKMKLLHVISVILFNIIISEKLIIGIKHSKNQIRSLEDMLNDVSNPNSIN